MPDQPDTTSPPAEPEATAPGTGLAVQNTMTGTSITSRIRYARELAQSGLLPSDYRTNPANVLYAVEYGLMLGIHPMAAITGIHVIEGKPTASSALMGALVRNADHKLRVRVTGTVEGGDIKATATLIRHDDPEAPFEATWTVPRALRAGLVDTYRQDSSGVFDVQAKTRGGKPSSWQKFPEAMLKARAISEVVREGAEEVLCGAHYTPEELGAMVDEDGAVIDGEIVSETLVPALEPVVEPMSPADAHGFRADLFAVYDSPDPEAGLRDLWRRAGQQREVTFIGDDRGEEVTIDRLLRRAIAMYKSGQRLVDGGRPQPLTAPQGPAQPPLAPGTPAAEPEPAADRTEPDAPVQADKDSIEDAVIVEDPPEGYAEPDAPADDPEQRRLLLDEIRVQAGLLGQPPAALVARQVKSRKQPAAQWPNAVLAEFVGQYRDAVCNMVTDPQYAAVIDEYRAVPPGECVDARALLAPVLEG